MKFLKQITTIFLMLIIISSVFISCNNTSNTKKEDSKPANGQQAAVYQCPMDCEHGKTYDKSGKCPVCEMDLVKK